MNENLVICFLACSFRRFFRRRPFGFVSSIGFRYLDATSETSLSTRLFPEKLVVERHFKCHPRSLGMT